MTQLIINDLEMNLELDRDALEVLSGGKNKGFRQNRRGRRYGYGNYNYDYGYKHCYKEYFNYGCYAPKYDYYTPKFYGYGC